MISSWAEVEETAFFLHSLLMPSPNSIAKPSSIQMTICRQLSAISAQANRQSAPSPLSTSKLYYAPYQTEVTSSIISTCIISAISLRCMKILIPGRQGQQIREQIVKRRSRTPELTSWATGLKENAIIRIVSKWFFRIVNGKYRQWASLFLGGMCMWKITRIGLYFLRVLELFLAILQAPTNRRKVQAILQAKSKTESTSQTILIFPFYAMTILKKPIPQNIISIENMQRRTMATDQWNHEKNLYRYSLIFFFFVLGFGLLLCQGTDSEQELCQFVTQFEVKKQHLRIKQMVNEMAHVAAIARAGMSAHQMRYMYG